MNRSSKVLWGEGLFLRPQHFQRQDLYHESRLAEMSRAIHPYLWGVRSLKFDTEALSGGILRVTELNAILPDGEFINAPGGDDLPDLDDDDVDLGDDDDDTFLEEEEDEDDDMSGILGGGVGGDDEEG